MRVPVIRELAGVHEYDGFVMDLSPAGRKAALGRLGPASPGERLADRHDERHLTAAEQAAHAEAEAGLWVLLKSHRMSPNARVVRRQGG